MCVVLLLLNDFVRRFNLSRTQALTLHLAFNTRGLQPMVECQLCGVSSSEARWAQYANGPHRRPLGEQCELCFLFVCCGMAVCHFHSLLPLPTFHKSIRFAFASAGLLLSVCFPRIEKRSVVSIDMTCEIDMTCDVVAPVSVCVSCWQMRCGENSVHELLNLTSRGIALLDPKLKKWVCILLRNLLKRVQEDLFFAQVVCRIESSARTLLCNLHKRVQ